MSEKSHARRLGFKLFLEGVEVDMISCKVMGGIGKAATASISIPSNEYAHMLLPRTLVHIFFYENRYELGTRAHSYEGSGQMGNIRPVNLSDRKAQKEKGIVSQLMDYNDIMNWKLLFAGEVMGYGFSKIGEIRSINLMCSDFSSYWSMAQMYWGGHKTSGDTVKRGIFVGATRLYHGPKTKVTDSDILLKVLQARPNGYLQPEGILGGIVSLLESATGVFSAGYNGKKHCGVNDMMSYAELRLHLTRTIGASDLDQTASIFMSSNMFKKWLRQVGKNVKYTASFMQLILSLLPRIHYEWNSVPVPPYVPASETSLAAHKWESVPTRYRGSGNIGTLLRYAKNTNKIIQDLLNVTTRDSEYMAGISSSYDPIRYGPTGDENVLTINVCNSGLQQPDTLAGWKSAQQLRDMGLSLRLEMERKSKNTRAVKRQAVTIQGAFECAAKAVELCNLLKNNPNARTYNNMLGIVLQLNCIKEKAGKRLKVPIRRVKTEGNEASSRLHMHLFRPDLYMCPPPKCNVLFPDMVQAIQYSRSWMSEITRLWLFTRNSSGRSMQDMYFAPTTSLILGADQNEKVSSAEEAVRQRTSFHMNHERYSGIVPVFEAVSDYAEMKKAYRKNVSKDDDLKSVPNAHLMRAANFMFFKRRFGSRTMQVTCRFSPQLVAGLPCMILDPVEKTNKRVDRFDINNEGDGSSYFLKHDEVFEGTGTHFFGVIHHIEHIIDSAGGAQTRILLSHCRTHTEGPEIFGSGDDDLSTWTFRTITSKRKKGTYKAELIGGGNGNVDVYNRDWEDVLGTNYNSKATYTADVVRTVEGKPKYTHFPASHISKVIGIQDPSTHPRKDKAVKTTESGAVVYGPTGGQLGSGIDTDGDGQADVSPTRTVETLRIPAVELKVYELTKSRRAKKINFTFEGIVTPPWYANIFFPDKIGVEYYDDMLGCRSVLDDAAILLDPEMAAKHKKVLEDDKGNLLQADPLEDAVEMLEIYNNYPVYSEKSGKYEHGRIFVPKVLLQTAKSARYAAEYLAEAWIGFKRAGIDINMFMDTYVDRSYATMLDIFGNENEDAYGTMFLGPKGKYLEGENSAKTKGFHGYAYSSKLTDLANLEGAEERLATATSKTMKKRAVKKEIDTRVDKYKRVRLYKNALLDHARDYGGKK